MECGVVFCDFRCVLRTVLSRVLGVRNGCGGFIGFVTAPFRQPMFGSVRHGGFRHVAVLFGLSWCYSVGSQFSVVLVWLGLIPRIAILVLRFACSVAVDFGPTRFAIVCHGLGRVAARSVFFKYIGSLGV